MFVFFFRYNDHYGDSPFLKVANAAIAISLCFSIPVTIIMFFVKT